MNEAGAWRQASRCDDECTAFSREGRPPTVPICGIRIHRLTLDDVVCLVDGAIHQGRTLSIGVVNAAKIVNMRRDRLLRHSVESSDVVLADGTPLVWLSRLKGSPLPERVTGIDLMFALFRLADQKGLRVYLLGATRSTIERVAEVARRDYPGMILAGYRDGYFTPEEESQVADTIHRCKAQMLFVAMTSPKKEKFMNRWGDAMGVPICHGVGGSFDVMAGVTRRAPRWMQKAGLEWFYRVMQEPRRMWKRYLVTNLFFSVLAARDLLAPEKLD